MMDHNYYVFSAEYKSKSDFFSTIGNQSQTTKTLSSNVNLGIFPDRFMNQVRCPYYFSLKAQS